MVRRYQTASLGASLRALRSCQELSSRLMSSPCGRSPAWYRHSAAGRLSKVERRSITLCDSGESDWIIRAACDGDCAATGKVRAEMREAARAKMLTVRNMVARRERGINCISLG